jgi:WD40 repeat protein
MLQEVAILRGHQEDRVWHVSWSPKGTHLASCGEDKVVFIWASSTGNWEDKDSIHVVATLEDAQSRTIRCCEWSPTGKYIACASFDGTVVVWESQNQAKTRWDQVAGLEGHENEVKSVAWSRTGQWLATCGRDKKVWVWERLSSKSGCEFECVSMLDGHSQDVKFVQWHPRQDNVLFSCSYDDTIKVWRGDSEGEDFTCIQTLTNHTSTVWGLAVYDSTPADDAADQDPTVPYYEPPSRLLSCGADLALRLWEQALPTGKNASDRSVGQWNEQSVLHNLHTFPIYSVSWNNDTSVQCANVLAGGGIAGISGAGAGGLIATGGGDNAVHIVQVLSDSSASGGALTLQHVQSIPDAHEGDINCVRWGPRPACADIYGGGGGMGDSDDQLLLLAAPAPKQLDNASGKTGGGRGGSASPRAAAPYVLPASHLLATAGDDGTVRLWRFVDEDADADAYVYADADADADADMFDA